MNFHFEHYEELPSTSTLALEYAAEGADEGVVIVASHQTDGRGKPGNSWQSTPGKDLLFSIIIRPAISPMQAPMLTQVACRSIASVLEKNYALDCTFKRPNDILIGKKKICGVLIESSSKAKDRLEFAVVGVGLNVNSETNELLETATSVYAETGRKSSLEDLLTQILEQLVSDVNAMAPQSQRK